jgi:hypothetical protein
VAATVGRSLCSPLYAPRRGSGFSVSRARRVPCTVMHCAAESGPRRSLNTSTSFVPKRLPFLSANNHSPNSPRTPEDGCGWHCL